MTRGSTSTWTILIPRADVCIRKITEEEDGLNHSTLLLLFLRFLQKYRRKREDEDHYRPLERPPLLTFFTTEKLETLQQTQACLDTRADTRRRRYLSMEETTEARRAAAEIYEGSQYPYPSMFGVCTGVSTDIDTSGACSVQQRSEEGRTRAKEGGAEQK